MVDLGRVGPVDWLRTKFFVFAFIAAMALYVIYHNERFLIEPMHPVWQHYRSIGWSLLAHGVAGACALVLVPLQFPTACAYATPSCIGWSGAFTSRGRSSSLHWGRTSSIWTK